MKKAFGILFIIVGLILVVFGVMAITNINTRNDTLGGRFSYEINRDYKNQSDAQQIIGAVSTGAGVLLFIIGLVMVSTRSNSQRKKEHELEMFNANKKNATNNKIIDKSEKRYFTHDGKNQNGPYSFNDLKEMGITEETPIWVEGLKNWEKAGRLRSLLELFKKVTPPPINQFTQKDIPAIPKITAEYSVGRNNSEKSKNKKWIIYTLILISALIVTALLINKFNYSSHNNSNTNGYQDRKRSVKEIEQENPLDFLYVTGSYSENFWGDKIKIQCEVSNNATVAVYKDVTIQFSYYSESETLIGTETETIYEFFEPGETKTYNYKIPNYKNTNSLGCDIIKAKVKY